MSLPHPWLESTRIHTLPGHVVFSGQLATALLRSTKNRLIHTVLRCYAMFLKPLKYKVSRRISCFLASLGFVLFFRLFLRPVSKMLAEPGRETNTNELWFVAELTFLTL